MDEALRRALDGEALYKTSFPSGHKYVYRALSLREYKIFRALRETTHEYEVYSLVFERCCGSLIANNAPAGLEISVGRAIMWISGDCETLDRVKQDIEQIRVGGGHLSLPEQMKQWVCVAQPAYTIKDMDQWNREQLLTEFVRSEEILMKKHPGYKALDVNSIHMAGDEPKKVQAPIDFKKENAQMASGMGPHAMEEAEMEERRTRKLTPQQAKMLKKKKGG